MEKTLKEQVKEQFAVIEQTIATAIKNGAKVRRVSKSLVSVDGLDVFCEFDGASAYVFPIFTDPSILVLFKPSKKDLEERRAELQVQIDELDKKIEEAAQ